MDTGLTHAENISTIWTLAIAAVVFVAFCWWINRAARRAMGERE